ncbi:MAG: hypothetical protein KF906_04090 [Actinobacteria bacterium]|nr:hypothetical protein [Actinomycetota bacterium]
MPGPDHEQLGLGIETDAGAPQPSSGAASEPDGRVVRVRPDVVGIGRSFDYLVAPGTRVEVGDVVRVRLSGRPVRGWVTAVDVVPDDGHRLLAVTRVSGRGPTPDLIELATWAAWRWAGTPAHFLRTASPDANVDRLPGPASRPARPPAVGRADDALGPSDRAVVSRALDESCAVLRWPPAADRTALVRTALARSGGGSTLVLVPGAADARVLADRLRRDGRSVALRSGQGGAAAAGQWARARSGADVVVGTRSAAWCPVGGLGRVLVLDEHDEAYQGDQTPSWHARDVAVERARRAGVPCLLVSPTPTLEALAAGPVFDPGPGLRRAGWPRLEVVDQRDLDPALGPLFSPALVDLVRSGGRVLCVLNRTGRVRLLACSSCRTLARCDVCDAAVSEEQAGDAGEQVFVCSRDTTHRRPPLCLDCGATTFRNLRLGVGRAREELEVLVGEPVGEVTRAGGDPDPGTRVLIGTEAVLHRVDRADGVAFLDLDQHLLAPRYRAGEQTLAILARASRIVGRTGGRLLVQTRSPDHPVVVAVRRRDPASFSEDDAALRRSLGLPPFTAMALVSGPGGAAFVEGIGPVEGLAIQGPVDGVWRLRAPDHGVLCDALAATARPPERLRIEVDPLGS